MKTIMFTGHRDSISDQLMLDNIAALYEDSIWIHGGAIGFDAQVESTAKKNGIKTKVYKPDYKSYNARTAPIIRNREMLNACDMVVACYDGRKHGGTYFVVTEAKRTNKKIIILSAHRHKSTQPE